MNAHPPSRFGDWSSWPPRIPVTLLLAVTLGLLFQGTRGVWEPDEGFYANVGLAMAQGHDWLVPRLNGDPFLDKPPFVYWSVAAGLRLLGTGAWGARLFHALWFAATVGIVAAAGSRLVNREAGRWAGLVYATSLLPFMAANILTPDTILAFCVAAAGLAYIAAEHDGDASPHLGAWLAFGLATGCGILAKGPAPIVFLAPLAVDMIRRRGPVAGLVRPGPWIAVLAAVAVGAPWYVTIIRQLPGAATYFWENQVSQRLFTATLHRNERWYGALTVYVPSIGLGLLPWAALWPGIWRREGRPGFRRMAAIALRDPRAGLLALWIVLPIAVLMTARSRLPLYALPLAVPLAVATGWALARGARISPRILAACCVGFLAIKLGAAYAAREHDTRAFARRLESLVGPEPVRVVCVDTKRNALPFYGFPDVMAVTTDPDPYPFFSRLLTLPEALDRVSSEAGRHAIVIPQGRAEAMKSILDDARLRCAQRGSIGREVVLLCEP